MFSVLTEIGDERVFVTVVYRVHGSLNNSIECLIENMKDFVTNLIVFSRYKCKRIELNGKRIVKSITGYSKEGNVKINFRDMRTCIEEMIKKCLTSL